MNFENCRLTRPTTVRNVSGSHVIDRYVEFNPFPQISGTTKQTFLIFDFHPFFDGLIGYESLKNLHVDILTSTNELKFPYGILQMRRKYPDTTSLNLNAHETKAVSVPSNAEGDFLLENDIEIEPNVFIHSGLYAAKNGHVQVFITNNTNELCKIELSPDILKPEINNFETGTPDNGLCDETKLEKKTL